MGMVNAHILLSHICTRAIEDFSANDIYWLNLLIHWGKGIEAGIGFDFDRSFVFSDVSGSTYYIYDSGSFGGWTRRRCRFVRWGGFGWFDFECVNR
jgi:hypothetical protein